MKKPTIVKPSVATGASVCNGRHLDIIFTKPFSTVAIFVSRVWRRGILHHHSEAPCCVILTDFCTVCLHLSVVVVRRTNEMVLTEIQHTGDVLFAPPQQGV